MNFKSFLTPQYLFQINSAFIDPKEKLFFLGGAILILLSVVLKISSLLAPTAVDKKYRQKFYRLFLTIGLLEVFWYLCRWQNVRFFDTHFVAWLWLLIGVVWFAKILFSFLKNYRTEKVIWEKQQVRLRYLPRN